MGMSTDPNRWSRCVSPGGVQCHRLLISQTTRCAVQPNRLMPFSSLSSLLLPLFPSLLHCKVHRPNTNKSIIIRISRQPLLRYKAHRLSRRIDLLLQLDLNMLHRLHTAYSPACPITGKQNGTNSRVYSLRQQQAVLNTTRMQAHASALHLTMLVLLLLLGHIPFTARARGAQISCLTAL